MSSSSLLSFLVRRSAAAALLILIVLSLTFFFIHLAPGDPTLVLQDPRLTAEQREAMRRAYGLDRPLAAQYLSWLHAVVFDADWGISYVHSRACNGGHRRVRIADPAAYGGRSPRSVSASDCWLGSPPHGMRGHRGTT